MALVQLDILFYVFDKELKGKMGYVKLWLRSKLLLIL